MCATATATSPDDPRSSRVTTYVESEQHRALHPSHSSPENRAAVTRDGWPSGDLYGHGRSARRERPKVTARRRRQGDVMARSGTTGAAGRGQPAQRRSAYNLEAEGLAGPGDNARMRDLVDEEARTSSSWKDDARSRVSLSAVKMRRNAGIRSSCVARRRGGPDPGAGDREED